MVAVESGESTKSVIRKELGGVEHSAEKASETIGRHDREEASLVGAERVRVHHLARIARLHRGEPFDTSRKLR